MKRNALIAVVAVFLLGLISGTVLGRYYLGRYRWTGPLERRHLHSLSEELGLSDKQKAEITPILNEAQKEILQRRLEWLEKSAETIDRLANRVRPFLQPAQMAKLDELTARFRSEKEQRTARLKRRRESLRSDGSRRQDQPSK